MAWAGRLCRQGSQSCTDATTARKYKEAFEIESRSTTRATRKRLNGYHTSACREQTPSAFVVGLAIRIAGKPWRLQAYACLLRGPCFRIEPCSPSPQVTRALTAHIPSCDAWDAPFSFVPLIPACAIVCTFELPCRLCFCCLCSPLLRPITRSGASCRSFGELALLRTYLSHSLVWPSLASSGTQISINRMILTSSSLVRRTCTAQPCGYFLGWRWPASARPQLHPRLNLLASSGNGL